MSRKEKKDKNQNPIVRRAEMGQFAQNVAQDLKNLAFSIITLAKFLNEKGVIDEKELTTYAEKMLTEQNNPLMAAEAQVTPDGTVGPATVREATPEEVAAQQN